MRKIKRVWSTLLVCVLLLVMLPVGSISVGATSRTQAEAVAWIESTVGQGLDYDGSYGVQCVDLVKYYYQYLGVSPVKGNGSDYDTNALPSGWQRIAYYSGFVAQPGDIAVWTWTKAGGSYGHVALVTSATSSKMTVVDQNGQGHTNSGYSTYAYGSSTMTFYGVIRPNFANTYSSIDRGVYYLRNKGIGNYMCVSYGVDSQAQNIDLLAFVNGSTAMQFEIYSSPTPSGYAIRPLCSSSRLVNVYATSVVSGKNVCIYDNVSDGTQRWQFEKVSGGYKIHVVSNPSCVLDIKDGWDVRVYTSVNNAANQIWVLENLVQYDANGGSGAPGFQFKTYGENLTLSKTVPTRSGYTFLGWSTSANATTATYKAGGTYNTNSNVTLYAVWKKDTTAPKTTTTAKTTTTKAATTKTTTTKTNASTKHTHAFGNWTTAQQATCTVSGKQARYCSCGASETRTVAPTGHSLSNWKTDKPTTCTSGGTEKRTCARCSYSTSRSTAALGHDFADPVITKEATCTEAGIESGKCKRCSVQTTQAIAPLGHQFSNPTVTKAATLYSEGVLEGTCSNCHEVTSSTIPCAVTDEATGVRFETQEGVFPMGTEAKVGTINEGHTQYSTVQQALSSVTDSFVAYDILALQGATTVQPNGEVTVTIPIPESLGNAVVLYHIGANNELTPIDCYQDTEQHTVSFIMSSTGLYAVGHPHTALADASDTTVVDWLLARIGTVWLAVGIGAVLILAISILLLVLLKKRK